MKKVLSRFASPAGLLLAVVLFLFLPVVSVSCDTGVGEARVDYSGMDLAVDGKPSLEVPPAVQEMIGSLQELGSGLGGSDDPPPEPAVTNERTPTAGTVAMIMTIATLVLLLAGLVVSLLPVTRRRPVVLASVAGAAAVVMIAAQVVSQLVVESSFVDNAREDRSDRTVERIQSLLGDAIGAGTGFWLALVATLLVALAAVAVMTAPRWRRYIPVLVPATGASPDPAPPPAPEQTPDVPPSGGAS